MGERLACLLTVLLVAASTSTADEPCVGPAVVDPSPLTQNSCIGAASVQINVTATATEPLSYRWRRGTTVLVDGTKHSGVSTATLTVHNLAAGDPGDNYNCVVTNDCGTATSTSAALTVKAALAGDFDHDCDVDSDDLAAFDACRVQSGPSVPAPPECSAEDLDTDTDIDLDDFAILQQAYANQGEPAPPPMRDIVFVLDLSLSQAYESTLMSYRLVDVGAGMRGVWAWLWDTTLTSQPTQDVQPLGPSFGNMNTWGTAVIDANWDYASDPGLAQLKRGTNWTLTSAWASQSLAMWWAMQSSEVQATTPAAYTAAEMSVINKSTGAGSETSTSNSTQLANYRRRVLVALGIYRWKSGKSGGQPGGNGDNVIDAIEIETLVPYPSSASNPATLCKQIGGSWDEFVQYVADTSKADNITSNTGLSYRFLKYDPNTVCYGNPALRWRFGLKTLIDYVQILHYTQSQSPGLAGAPEQPLNTEINAIRTTIEILQDMQCADQIGLVSFGQFGYGPVDRPDNMSWLMPPSDFGTVIDKASGLQAAMWTGNTNTSQGIDKAAGTGGVTTGVLSDTAQNFRSDAAKIMILLTDGDANVRRNGNSDASPFTIADADALAAATEALSAGKRLYVIKVGHSTITHPEDLQFIENLAQAGGGTSFIAADDPAAYHAQLLNLIQQLPQ